MNTRLLVSLFSVALAGLLLAGCDDSKNPLSDPQTSKPDSRLAGVWRQRADDGNTTFYHVGRAGENLPGGVMRVVTVTHSSSGELQPPGQVLVFPTKLAGGTYLNMIAGDQQQLKALEETGWKSVESYTLLKYQVEGDTLLVWTIEEDAKRKAIESGQVKGVIEKQGSGGRATFTDTAENLDRFVAGAADSLFSKEPIRLERVK